jgi:hypothetical protein
VSLFPHLTPAASVTQADGGGRRRDPNPFPKFLLENLYYFLGLQINPVCRKQNVKKHDINVLYIKAYSATHTPDCPFTNGKQNPIHQLFHSNIPPVYSVT